MPLPDAQEVVLADAVVAELNDPSRPWAGLFTAARLWEPVYEIADLEKVKVAVVPLTIAEEPLDRARTQYAYSLAIDFQLKATPGDLAGPDSVCALAQAVNAHFKKRGSLPTAPGWHVKGATRNDVYSLEMLYGQKVFETLVTLDVQGGQ